jgi:UDP-perosamine 4-acetyltransferase
MIPVAGVGAGGHAKVIIDILRQGNRYEVVALTDNNPKLWGSSYCDVPIIGDDHMLTSLRPKVEHAFLGIGSVRSSALRSHLYQMVRELGLEFLNAIHPTAVISPTAKLGCGVAVMAGAIVNPGATIAYRPWGLPVRHRQGGQELSRWSWGLRSARNCHW